MQFCLLMADLNDRGQALEDISLVLLVISLHLSYSELTATKTEKILEIII